VTLLATKMFPGLCSALSPPATPATTANWGGTERHPTSAAKFRAPVPSNTAVTSAPPSEAWKAGNTPPFTGRKSRRRCQGANSSRRAKVTSILNTCPRCAQQVAR
jgi:hypothetical protein